MNLSAPFRPCVRLFIESSERLLNADWIEACFNDWDLGQDDKQPDNLCLFDPPLSSRESTSALSYQMLPDKLSSSLMIRSEVFGALMFDRATSRIIQLDHLGSRIAKTWLGSGKDEALDLLTREGAPTSEAEYALVSFAEQLLHLGQNR